MAERIRRTLGDDAKAFYAAEAKYEAYLEPRRGRMPPDLLRYFGTDAVFHDGDVGEMHYQAEARRLTLTLNCCNVERRLASGEREFLTEEIGFVCEFRDVEGFSVLPADDPERHRRGTRSHLEILHCEIQERRRRWRLFLDCVWKNELVVVTIDFRDLSVRAQDEQQMQELLADPQYILPWKP